uniref:Guanylate cyclase domain-containing protein n=1 Tax=Setaria digitata TaxID=48799 RepID=A0A915PNN7_9BILA
MSHVPTFIAAQLISGKAVFKIETIDDTYVTVRGIPEQTENHCELLYHLVVDMTFEVQSVIDPITGKPLQIRFGINSAAVLVGVIGKKMPRHVALALGNF